MVEARAIETVVDEIARRFKPERVILFGSYAYGVPNEDSDVDLLVVKRYRGKSYLAASRIHDPIEPRFPMDIIVRSPAEVKRRLAIEDYFIMDIVEQGIVLHEANNPRVGEQGRRRLRRRLHTPPLEKAQPV